MRKLLTILAISVFILYGLPSSPSYAQDTKTIADLLQDSATNSAKPEFTIYLAALKAGDPKLLARLSDKTVASTVFAPTDAAFTRYLKIFGSHKIDELVKYATFFDPILRHSIVPGVALNAKILTADAGAQVGTMLNDSIPQITLVKDKLRFDDAPIDVADLQANNGDLYGVSGGIYTDPNLDLTVFSQPPAAPTAAAATLSGNQAKSLAEILSSSTQYKTLAAALNAADPSVLKTLGSDGPYTLFAPTDQGFTDSLKALNLTNDQLLKRADLTQVLLYHVVPGSISHRQLDVYVNLAPARDNKPLMLITLTGQVLIITSDGDLDALNGGPHTHSVDRAANGQIYKIDGVLFPKP